MREWVFRSLGNHHRGVGDRGGDPNRGEADDRGGGAAHEHIGERAVLGVGGAGHRGLPLSNLAQADLELSMMELSRVPAFPAVAFVTPQTHTKSRGFPWNFRSCFARAQLSRA